MQGITSSHISAVISTVHGNSKTHGLNRGCVLCLRLYRNDLTPAFPLLPNPTELVLQNNRIRNSFSNNDYRSVTKPEEACKYTSLLLMFQINWVLHFVGSIARKSTSYS